MRTCDLTRAPVAHAGPATPGEDPAAAGGRRAVSGARLRPTAGRLGGALALALVAACGLPPGPGGEPPTPTEPTRVSFGGLRVDLPQGWEVISQDPAGEPVQTMCVGPAGNPYPRYDDCSGLTFHHGEPLPGFELDEYRDHGPWGWYHQTDVSPCPDRPYDPGQPLDGIQPTGAGYDPVETGERLIDGRTAVYDRWEARCELSGFTFSPRAWHVDEARILIVDVLGQPETEEVLDSVRWTG